MRIGALPILVLPLLLAACSTPQQRAERLQAEMAELMAIYGPPAPAWATPPTATHGANACYS